jgi:hypothetical protein
MLDRKHPSEAGWTFCDNQLLAVRATAAASVYLASGEDYRILANDLRLMTRGGEVTDQSFHLPSHAVLHTPWAGAARWQKVRPVGMPAIGRFTKEEEMKVHHVYCERHPFREDEGNPWNSVESRGQVRMVPNFYRIKTEAATEREARYWLSNTALLVAHRIPTKLAQVYKQITVVQAQYADSRGEFKYLLDLAQDHPFIKLCYVANIKMHDQRVTYYPAKNSSKNARQAAKRRWREGEPWDYFLKEFEDEEYEAWDYGPAQEDRWKGRQDDPWASWDLWRGDW